MVGSFSSTSMPSRPFSANEHLHLLALQQRGQREDVAQVVVDDQHLAPGQAAVGRVDLFEHAALQFRQRGRASGAGTAPSRRAGARASARP